eukprot:CAMPEP_0203762002 /NCGR_PEP_ID=MMETSP0098-20131031/14975_1 /ASSEMBLY_ACC=CAM_ASM_000208 /TAXON_ID=96639 /ORGANISM=" , Strain NY0313808BC1" /LENGTH=353 /DNA_ID=CAMNT_0050656229 /DNA_START=69 /DNA_END=1127 /DNA_ORIENTATION=-
MGIGIGVFKLSLAVLLAAFGVSLVKPELFLLLPNGFVLWAITGHDMPPYFDQSTFKNTSWLKEGDVIVDVQVKCGTNWMLTIVHELRTWNLDHLREFEQINDVAPWAEFVMYPGQTPAERPRDWGQPGKPETWNSPEYPFRLFKSHLLPFTGNADWDKDAGIQVEKVPNVKFIVMSRNSKDVIYSLYPFLASHREKFRATWGGFPPVYEGTDGFEEHLDFCLQENIQMATFIRNWWQFRNEPNVLLLHYSDVLNDTPGSLRRIAKYLDLQVPDQALKNIAERVSIKFMRARNSRYLYRYGKDRESLVIKSTKGSIIRKGGTGDYKSVMSPEGEAKIEKHLDRVLGADTELRKW